ncbi:MAG TPA: hypothetical protein VFT12_07965, partial [Thermoanaerobaculia bacterium]|nr:hypothetical protein [Thermoanaerobaculia bacterium]
TAGEVMESSYAMADGSLVLRHDVLVAAPPDRVWEEVMKSAKGERLSYIPNEMLSVRSGPELFTVIQLLRINDPQTTRIRMSTLPFRSADEIYERLRRDNVLLLREIEQRFVK